MAFFFEARSKRNVLRNFKTIPKILRELNRAGGRSTRRTTAVAVAMHTTSRPLIELIKF